MGALSPSAIAHGCKEGFLWREEGVATDGVRSKVVDGENMIGESAVERDNHFDEREGLAGRPAAGAGGSRRSCRRGIPPAPAAGRPPESTTFCATQPPIPAAMEPPIPAATEPPTLSCATEWAIFCAADPTSFPAEPGVALGSETALHSSKARRGAESVERRMMVKWPTGRGGLSPLAEGTVSSSCAAPTVSSFGAATR